MFVDMFLMCNINSPRTYKLPRVFAADSRKDKVKENCKHQSELQNLLCYKDYTSICPGTDQFGKL